MAVYGEGKGIAAKAEPFGLVRGDFSWEIASKFEFTGQQMSRLPEQA